ncbi:MAG: hypothetical protein KGO96_12815 [Elusimicrobia bacterium]|nr:hypothetical protein [Elusimicrobiota bacterium]
MREIFRDRGGSSGGVSRINVSRQFQVWTSTAADDFLTILASYPGPGPSLLPALYDLHPNSPAGGPAITCRNASGRQNAGGVDWLFTYDYSSEPIDRDMMDRELYPNPIMRPARCSGGAGRYAAIPKMWIYLTTRQLGPDDAAYTGATPDRTGCGITTSAGEPYDSLPEIDDSRWSLHFSKNYDAQKMPSWLFSWDPDTVNSKTVQMLGRTFGPRTLKLAQPKFSDVQRENGVDFRTIDFDIDYDALGHTYKVADRGFSVNVSGTVKKILLGDGTYPTVPQLLNGSGGLLAGTGNTAANVPDTALAYIREGAVYPEQDFKLLPINESYIVPTFSAKGGV